MSANLSVVGYDPTDFKNNLSDDQINGQLLAKSFAAKGITGQDAINKFLNPNIDRDWENPYNIDGMEKVVNVVEKGIRNNKNILIYGDYDLDGISATAVMILGLKKINRHANSKFKLNYFIPDRFQEGYGFCEKSVARVLSFDPRPELIITVDCGITADKELQHLKENGIDIVVTDHHEKSDNYPEAFPVIDPKAQDKINKSADLAGVGVALKLIQVLGSRFGMPNMWQDLIDVAMLGTVADIMPLLNENRALVACGLEMLNKKPRPCLKALIDVAGKSNQKISSTDLAFTITPRLNSAGRLNKPELALKLLISDNYVDAYNIAVEIEDLNNQRKTITEDLTQVATYQAKKIIESNPNKRSLVLAGENWHDGVRGIVAAKIADKFGLPTLIFSIKDGIACGSGRSKGQVDLHDACAKSFDNFIKFGGHKGACGASLDANCLDEFSNNFEHYMQGLDEAMFVDFIEADFPVDLHELDIQSVEELSKLEPFGKDNEEPKLLACNVFIKRAKAVGKDHNHLSCYISDGAYGSNAIMFFVDDVAQYLKHDGTVAVVFKPKIEEFQSRMQVKLYIEDIIKTEDLYEEKNQGDNFLDSLFDTFNQRVVSKNTVGNFIQSSVNSYNRDVLSNKSKAHVITSKTLKNKDYSSTDYDALQEVVVKAMIGQNGKLHQSQIDCLNLLRNKKSALAVMPTGRGKSLIFQVYATMLALKENVTSMFIYPLRALISDQAYHLKTSLGDFGISVEIINGETPQDKRDEIFRQLSYGNIDIILTTPEFASIHVNEFSDNAKIGFIVVDECHHLGDVRIGQRSAYGTLPQILEKLDNPQVLALSATINDQIFGDITDYLPIKEVVKDDFERENLYVDDRRNLNCRDDYLASLAASGQKCLIYVNSREQTIDLARMIKSRAPHIAMQVGFYNAGMTKEQRKKIEEMFRDNKLVVLVATSAFGEGVNIPDVRHVCLYHLPFSEVEFNQMAGRCGRDNLPALIHLLYNRADASINNQILAMTNPNRDELGKIYKWIIASAQTYGGVFTLNHENFNEMYESGTAVAAPATVFCALDVFSELGLINVKTIYKDGQTYSKIKTNDNVKRVNLEDSSRFCEGQNEVSHFNEYKNFAMRSSSDDLRKILRHPILPMQNVR